MFKDPENRKETLRLSDIIKELKTKRNRLIAGFAAVTVFFALCCALALALCLSNDNLARFFGVTFAAVCLIPIFGMVLIMRDIVSISKTLSKATVVTDKLVGKEIKYDCFSPVRRSLSTYKTYRFHFSGYGEFVLSDFISYEWSNLPMSADRVYENADINDEFYLVLTKPNTGKIVLAYNRKLFELK